MTFDVREASAELGAPIMLAQFVLGMKVWHFVAADQDVEFEDTLYESRSGGMKLSRIQDSAEFTKNNLTMTVDRLHPIAELWRVSPPTSTVAVLLKEIHQDEVDDSVAWLGHVSNVGWNSDSTADITLTPGTSAMQSNGLRRLWQRGCPHVLYGPGCKLDMESHGTDVTVTAVDGLDVTGAEFATAGTLAGGFLKWTSDDGIPEYRTIMSALGTKIRMMTAAPTLAVGTVVRAYEGCDHTIGRCAELDNTENYGGIPQFQGKNPFNGAMIY